MVSCSPFPAAEFAPAQWHAASVVGFEALGALLDQGEKHNQLRISTLQRIEFGHCRGAGPYVMGWDVRGGWI